ALQAASWEGNDEIVQLLLERGADVHAGGGKCGNALQASSFMGHINTVQLLLKSGARASYSHPATFSRTWGAHVELCNPLQAACLEGHMSVAELLLDHGVEQEHLDTALQSALAKGSSYQHIVDLLLAHGAKQK
ncbi:ankyrin repeat-containing domain protein, partial [Amanita rubescens]